MPTPTTEVSIVPNAHRVPPLQKRRRLINKRRVDGLTPHFSPFFCLFWLLLLFFLFSFNESRRNKASKKKCKKENKNYIQQGRIEFTLKEHPGRADLPVPHYSPYGQSAKEMALGVGH